MIARPEDHAHEPHGVPDRANGDRDMLELQREANEHLLLAGLRAREAVDDALGAKRSAEEEANELRATGELRERLIGIIGHDLRNPLNTIVMAGEFLMSRGSLSEPDAKLVNRIVESGHRMGRMIGQLVEFTRSKLGGGFQMKLATCDLGGICANIAEELRIGSSGEIHHTGSGDLTGLWDADRLAEAISNIAGNAVDHATPGTPVLIDGRDDGEAVIVEITNEGVCIPPDVLPLIFKAFRRGAATPSTEGDHLGLGLYIACEIVRAHRGSLGVRSSDGTTTFSIRLPRRPPPAESATPLG